MNRELLSWIPLHGRSRVKYDEETGLWKPSRRSFFFFGASAAVGAMLPEIVAPRLTATEVSIRMNQALAITKGRAMGPTTAAWRWLDQPFYPVTIEDLRVIEAAAKDLR